MVNSASYESWATLIKNPIWKI